MSFKNQGTAKNQSAAHATFKKSKRVLKPFEEVAKANARKTERLRALRLAKEAEDRVVEAGKVEPLIADAAPVAEETKPGG